MTQLQPQERVVITGTFLYDGEVVCDVRIVYSPVRYGSGDYEDEGTLANDQAIDSYYVHYGSTTERQVFTAGSGAFPSLAAAMRHVEAAVRGVNWHA